MQKISHLNCSCSFGEGGKTDKYKIDKVAVFAVGKTRKVAGLLMSGFLEGGVKRTKRVARFNLSPKLARVNLACCYCNSDSLNRCPIVQSE